MPRPPGLRRLPIGGEVLSDRSLTRLAAARFSDAMTFSRVGAAGLLAWYAFTGRSRTAAWTALLIGCTVSDWFDGRLARWSGCPGPGQRYDVEVDSWLTLWAALAAYRRTALGPWVLIPPVLRYPVAIGLRRPKRPWPLAAGTAQMVALTAALSPWPRARRFGRLLAPVAAAAQVLALLTPLLERRSARW